MGRGKLLFLALFVGLAASALAPVSGAGDGFGRDFAVQKSITQVSLRVQDDLQTHTRICLF
jgi:hypothetical protein